jgi:hypothetical protein
MRLSLLLTFLSLGLASGFSARDVIRPSKPTVTSKGNRGGRTIVQTARGGGSSKETKLLDASNFSVDSKCPVTKSANLL